MLGQILLVAGRELDPDPDSDFRVRLRLDGQPDLLVTVKRGDATLVWADDEQDEPYVELDPAARQLFIWGGAPMIPVGFAATWHSPISPGCRPCCPDTDQPGTASADQLSQATER